MSFEDFDLVNKNDCVNNFINVYGNDTNVSEPWVQFTQHIYIPPMRSSEPLPRKLISSTHNNDINVVLVLWRLDWMILHHINSLSSSLVGFSALLGRLKHFCAVVAEPFESKTNRLHIRFYANKETINSTFSIYYSTFRKKRGSCEANELDCEDDTCIISEGLKCNKRPNCKFQKDEENCPQVRLKICIYVAVHTCVQQFSTRPSNSIAINNDNLFSSLQDNEDKNNDLLFIIIVFSALLGAMTSVFFFNCIRKLIRDQKIIRVSCRPQHQLINKSILIKWYMVLFNFIFSYRRNTSDNRKRVN